MECKYYSKTYLTSYVCPSVWGWKVNDNFVFMPKKLKELLLNFDVN
jgi:lipid A disaccharide synthetase